QVIHVGDDPEHDVLGAQRMGMHTGWMNSRGKSWPAEIAAADAAIGNLSELPDVIDQIARVKV
ncbi:MAG: HAD family hydrolase, partial [Halioglobus sp.]